MITANNRIAEDPVISLSASGGEGRGEVANGVRDTQSDSKPVEGRSSSSRFSIAGDAVARAVHNLPDDQRESIKWAAGYCRALNLTHHELAGRLTKSNGEHYSADSLYAAFTGRDDRNLGPLCESIDTLRKRFEETTARNSGTFIHTSLSKLIFAHCREAFLKHRVKFILGLSQTGKTRSIEEYARLHNHGETILVRMPTGGSLTHFINELALRLHIGLRQGNRADLRRRIIESFDDRTLLIIDECEQCISIGRGESGLAALEFAREIHDRRKCGLVLCGALNFRDALKSNYSLRKLWLRGYRPLQLPSVASKADLNLFAEAFGLDPAPDKTISTVLHAINDDGEEIQVPIRANPLALQTSVSKDYGLGRWLSILEDAQDTAKASAAKNTWGRVLAAHARVQAAESGQTL